jgi:translation initiation factor IF-3
VLTALSSRMAGAERLPNPEPVAGWWRTIVSAILRPAANDSRGLGFASGAPGAARTKPQEVRLIKGIKVTRVNRMIRIPRVMVVDEDGEQLGILETTEALTIAEERGLDLVEVAPAARPPVCKIMDYGKFKYEQAKKAKKAKQASHTVKVKTIQFRPKTDDHDYDFKKKHIVTFLQSGNKVKIVMRFRGREISHVDLALEFLRHLVIELQEFGSPESEPQREGRMITFVMAPKKV